MIDTQAIRSKILDLAMRGQLAEQLPEDGTAEELYQQIQAEKQELIRAGKIKKEKPLPEITEKDTPFDIPKSWNYVKLQDISSVISKGTTPRGGKVSYSEKGIGFLRAENLMGYDGINTSKLRYVDEQTHYGFLKRSILEAGDILVSIAGTLGKTGLVREEYLPLNTNQAIAFVRVVNREAVELRFIVYALNSTNIQKALLNKMVDMAIPNLSLNNISNIVIPFPPLAEQKRIVEKIDQAFSILDTIDALQTQYANNLTALKAKLIDAAIQGKLTEQLPEDGTAEELYQRIQAAKQMLIRSKKIRKDKLEANITDNEIPFTIPENWKWVRLRDLGVFSGGKTPSMRHKGYWENGVVPWITSKDMKQKYIASSEMLISEIAAREMAIHPKETVLFVVRSGILRRMFPVAILTESGTINQDLKALELYVPDMCEYVYYVLKGFESTILFKYAKDGTTVNNIVFDALLTMPIPLPPLAEQRRIVERLNGLFSALNR